MKIILTVTLILSIYGVGIGQTIETYQEYCKIVSVRTIGAPIEKTEIHFDDRVEKKGKVSSLQLINELSKKGWELCFVISPQNQSGVSVGKIETFYIFRRVKE